MLQTEIVISVITIITAFVISLLNAFRRRQFTINRFFVILSFLTSALFVLQLMLLLKFPYLSTTMNTRFYFSLIHWLSVLFFIIIQLFPNEPLRPRLALVLLTAIPSFILSTITAWTNLVITYANFTHYLTFQLGDLFPVYILITSFYLIGAMFILIFKSRFTLESKVLSKELQYISYGLVVSVAMLLLFTFALPMVANLNLFRNLGITVPGIAIIIIMNYAVYDIRIIDFKKFNLKFLKWIIIALTAFLPVYLLFSITGTYIRSIRVPGYATGLFIFLYLLFFYRVIKPFLDMLFDLEYVRLGNTFDTIFQSLSTFSMSDDSGVKWDDFYRETIERLISTFRLSGALYYQFDNNSRQFLLKYGTAHQEEDNIIDPEESIIQGTLKLDTIIDRTIIYSDIQFTPYKEAALKLMEKYNLHVLLPFYIFGEYTYGIQKDEKHLIGILLLGELPFGNLYSKTFLSALEIYRLQFQRLLANGFILEDVRIQQIFYHDKLVVSDIKKKLVPENMHHAGHSRSSSLYINNSQLGGDYLDSITPGQGIATYLLAETGYQGVESSLLALEIYSILHMNLKAYRNPEDLLAKLNWIIATSHYSSTPVTGAVVTVTAKGKMLLSTAASPPILLYNTIKDDFSLITSMGLPMGVEKKGVYNTISITPPSGSIALIYSTGLEASINRLGHRYELSRVKKIIAANHDETPAVITRYIYQDYMSFIKSKEQLNDVSLILIKF